MFNWIYKLYFSWFKGVIFGSNVKICFPCNLYNCIVNSDTKIGPFCEIQSGVWIGYGTCIQSHSFIAAETTVGDRVFIGHGVITANDKNPVAFDSNWKCEKIVICDDTSIGSGVNILPKVRIEKGAKVGQGAVVTKNVPSGETWVGNPAHKLENKNFKKDLEQWNQ